MKGRGTDLFFGEATEAGPAPAAEAPDLQTVETPPAPSPKSVRLSSTAPAPRRAARRSTAVEAVDDDDLPAGGRTNGRTDERTFDRRVVRHSFDIRQDHLLALTQLQTERFLASGRKPKLGEMVQEALDAYLRSHQKRTKERSSG